jgi:hypothetical protein
MYPTDEWVKKAWCIYMMEYYSAIKNGTGERPGEISQGQEDKHHMWNLEG